MTAYTVLALAAGCAGYVVHSVRALLLPDPQYPRTGHTTRLLSTVLRSAVVRAPLTHLACSISGVSWASQRELMHLGSRLQRYSQHRVFLH